MTHHVLIMDDDLDLSSQWRRAFVDAGIEARLACNRMEAEILLHAQRFDAVVVDIYIRTADGTGTTESGFLLIAHMRSPSLGLTPAWAKDTPIVAVTGAASSASFSPLDYAAQGGATAVMRKPFEPSELVEQVVALIADETIDPDSERSHQPSWPVSNGESV